MAVEDEVFKSGAWFDMKSGKEWTLYTCRDYWLPRQKVNSLSTRPLVQLDPFMQVYDPCICESVSKGGTFLTYRELSAASRF